MHTFIYKPKGVCSQEMRFEIEDNIIRNVTIVGGCAGNLLGISRIMKDKSISEIMNVFDGVKCGAKQTSCPDQISKALQAYVNEYLDS